MTKQRHHVINMLVQDVIISGQPTNAVTNAITGRPMAGSFISILQKQAGVERDKKLGQDTIHAFQRKMGTPADGKISRPSQLIKAIQCDVYVEKITILTAK